MSYGIFNKILDVYVDGQRAVNNNSYYSAIIVINKQMPFDAFKLCFFFKCYRKGQTSCQLENRKTAHSLAVL